MREQDACRIYTKIFPPHEVFNTCVDKFVEKAARRKANYTVLSTLNRFALFLCNSPPPSVPLRRSFQMYFDGLIRVRDVAPASVGLPAVRNYLNQYSAHRRARHVGRALAVGLHVQLGLLVLFDF